ncbi:diaminopimelate epimerase [Myroides sp. LJL115]
MLEFYKYQATGNDFILIDNRDNTFDKNNKELIAHLCDRRFGIGADGLILIQNDTITESDFEMIYINCDGNPSSMCGNGARAAVAFARDLDIISHSCNFQANDGGHNATIEGDLVKVQMKDVSQVEIHPKHSFVDTGSPHHIAIVRNLDRFSVYSKGQGISQGELYKPHGSNVNFVEQEGPNRFNIRTYERGVEDETLSCGTGATAVALAMYALKKADATCVDISVLGGNLQIEFKHNNGEFTQIFLKGPAEFVFKGEVNIN